MNTLTKRILTLIFLGVFSVSSFAHDDKDLEELEARIIALEEKVDALNAGKSDDQAIAALKTASKFLIPGAGLLTGIAGITGTGESEDSSEMDLPAAQTALERTLRNALAELNEAESYFAQARGDAEAAAISKSRAETLRGEDDVDIKEVLDATASSREKGAEFEASAGELNAESKALYVQGLVPYAKGVAETSKAAKEAQKFMKSATAEIKSIRNPMKMGKLRKTFTGGMAIGRVLPGFFKTLGESSKGVFSFAKTQKLDTKNAEASLPDEEFD